MTARRPSLHLGLLSLPLLLAACGQGTPTATPTSAGLVQLHLNAQALRGTLAPQTLRPQGAPTDAAGAPPAAQMTITVRDRHNAVVTFKNGVYAPDGDGDAAVRLNAANGFDAALLLPAGTYSFENVTKDLGQNGASTDTLLAYGPESENTQQIDKVNTTVPLKFHAVVDPNQSRLDFVETAHKVYINDAANLRVFARTGAVNGVAYTVPTTDLALGQTPYTIADPAQGTLGASSLLGVNVKVAGGLNAQQLNVTASLRAWVRQPGTDTAALQPISLNYSAPIELQSPKVPATIASPGASWNAPNTLTGTAESVNGLSNVRVYDAGVLIGSSDPADQSGSVAAVTFLKDLYGNNTPNWTMPWSAAPGPHTLSLRATDAAGNVTLTTPFSTVYSGDFEAWTANQWSSAPLDQTPTGRIYLGPFAYSDGTTLSVGSLPEHHKVTVTFDLYINNSMDGQQFNDERWTLSVAGGPILLSTNFANVSGFMQAYPGSLPSGSFPARTGTIENNTLGNDGYGDSVYRITRTFDHTGNTLDLTFAGYGIQDYGDESWGLDNVRVSVQ
ncbi:hypothetical protein [Deinococcus maricopensis]|uniref:DUF4382 domain-containing protein n=1 Tax=Deinococcus maricopensis (strain DSM 21211 / LMG 22137 / NRRL B-23946 / LB-34) TaxID=709986 RepID=E8U3A0_DEIML|nr:hypothetical protein [Deinococcus maricopensis]ADV66045.1 hypothetical protein Deima_0385 [Deinococcus maricopensis DSM 21211]